MIVLPAATMEAPREQDRARSSRMPFITPVVGTILVGMASAFLAFAVDITDPSGTSENALEYGALGILGIAFLTFMSLLATGKIVSKNQDDTEKSLLNTNAELVKVCGDLTNVVKESHEREDRQHNDHQELINLLRSIAGT